MDKTVKQLLKNNFYAPPPTRKDGFTQSIHYKEVSCKKEDFKEVIFSQIGFIRKRIWAIFILLLILGWYITNYIYICDNKIASISAILPILILTGISEIYRSTAYNMNEMELSCKYTLNMITLIKLSVLGVLSVSILLIYAFLISSDEVGVFRNLVYMGVPYLLTSNISLIIVSKYRSKDVIYICAGVCTFISIMIISLGANYEVIYSVSYIFRWVSVFVVLTILLICNLNKFRKSQGEIKWSY